MGREGIGYLLVELYTCVNGYIYMSTYVEEQEPMIVPLSLLCMDSLYPQGAFSVVLMGSFPKTPNSPTTDFFYYDFCSKVWTRIVPFRVFYILSFTDIPAHWLFMINVTQSLIPK